MSEMIDRVAAAMAERANGGKFRDPLFYAPEHKFFWMEVVKAGIAAMREPTLAMIAAAWHSESTSEIWQSMIDGALGDPSD